jgi:hypothetical protein
VASRCQRLVGLWGETWEWGDVGEGIGGEQWRRVEDSWDGVFEIFLRLLELHVAF